MTRIHGLLASVGVLIVASSAAPGGDLSPPAGPIGPTMKRLDSVEARECVNALPGDQESVHVISQNGSFYLTESIVVPAGKHGIKVIAPRVSIDMNGFSIDGSGQKRGDADPTRGVNHALYINPKDPNTTIVASNGRLSGVSGSGVYFEPAPPALNAFLDRLQFQNLGGSAVEMGSDGCLRMADCTISVTSGYGIRAAGGTSAIITGCCVSGCAQTGIQIERGVIRDCAATSNGLSAGYGISAGDATIEHCTVADNGSGGIFVRSSFVSGCVVKQNTGIGIIAAERCRIVSNLCEENTGPAGTTGIALTGPGSVVSDNTVSGSTTGVGFSGGPGVINNFIIRNTFSNVPTPLGIGAGNSYGPVVDVSAGGSLAGVAGAGHPWANFVH